jgi:hypothetical protein
VSCCDSAKYATLYFIHLMCSKKLEIQKNCYLIHLVQIVMYFGPICMCSIRTISRFSIDRVIYGFALLDM